jgi:DNA-binding NtrC family response regulator
VVVLVDDEPAILASIRRLLRDEPYELRATLDPYEALAWIERGTVSLIVADHRMKDLPGVELLRRVAQRSPATIRVMLTGYSGNAVVTDGLKGDIQWLVAKPWSNDGLKEALRELLVRKQKVESLRRRDPGPSPRSRREDEQEGGR